MFGGAQKSGRRGGGAGGKRSAHSVQNPSRASIGGGGGGGERISVSGSGLYGSKPQAQSAAAADETFSLVTYKPLSFAATLRLPPDFLEEIKRLETLGGAAKIKFDSNSSSHSGNVIDVGGKVFKFTWSHEASDKCDIYEEPPNNEDSNGLLIESGCPYRKLNVVRKLDESTKNRVKMRSVEAERMSKSRKTVVLDPSNPSMKNQIKAIAASEATPWKNFQKSKKEPPYKKRKFESNQIAEPPKVVHRSGFPSSASTKGRHSSSPLPSPQVQPVSLVSPSVAEYPNNTPANTGAATPISTTAEDNATKPERDASGKTFPGVSEIAGHRFNESSVSADLQSILTSLLKDNSNGMSLKALEKAVGTVFPSSSRKIEPILKKIATYQAPGRYILNLEAEQGSLKRCSQSGSSHKGNDLQASVSRGNHDDVASPKLVDSVEKSPDPYAEEPVTRDSISGEDVDVIPNIDISQSSLDHLGYKNSEGQAASSSDSGSDSDSDSDSSDSGSGSSRSRSPAGSGSGSSSDSESDSSSNSKEGSDVDVDIISDDENEPKHAMQGSNQGGHTSRDVDNGIVERMDDQQSEEVDIEGDQEDIEVGASLDFPSNADAKSTGEFTILPNQEAEKEHWTADMLVEPEQIVAFDVNKDNQDRVQTSDGKYKKASRMKKNVLASDNGKRSKGGSYAESPPSWSLELCSSESPHKAPDKLNVDQYNGSITEMDDRFDRDDNIDLASQRDGHQVPGKLVVEPEQSGRRPSLWSHDSDSQDKSSKCPGSHNNVHEAPVKQKNEMDRDARDRKGKANRKAKDSSLRNKSALQPDSLQRKQSDHMKKFHIGAVIGLSQQDGNRADAERFPPIIGRDKVLQRELSDLELGELREPLPMEIDGNDNQLHRQDSFNTLGTNLGTSDSINVNLNKRRLGNKPRTDLILSSADKGVRSGSARMSPLLNDEGLQNSMDAYGETHKQVHTRRQNESKQEDASISGRGTKSQKSNSSSKGVNKVRDAFSNGGHIDNHRSDSSLDENISFFKYEKDKPDLKEPVKDLMQYKEYVQEYTEGYNIYCSLNKVLEKYRNEFHTMGKDLDSAKSKDTTKYYRVLRQIRESYNQHGEKHKKLKKIFIVLHEELKHLKQRIKDFASAYNKA